MKSPFSMGVPLVLESSNSRMFKPFVMGANSKFEEGKNVLKKILYKSLMIFY